MLSIFTILMIAQGLGTSLLPSADESFAQRPALVMPNESSTEESLLMHRIPWKYRYGWVPGQVELQKWEVGEQTFYRITGATSPQSPHDLYKPYPGAAAPQQKEDAVFCEVRFLTESGTEIRTFSASAAHAYQRKNNQMVAMASVPEAEYDVQHEQGDVILTFETHKEKPVSNIVFRYRESGMEGWLSTDDTAISLNK